MPPAARAGDNTDHGTPLNAALGSPNVRIGGQAAWRTVTDVHTCPQSDGNKPHVGGVVTVGSSKVFINGFAAARQGDAITEAGRPNSITGGSTKVQIG
jgi:uncharacterized Zn-binding protein involved in type VI secretion